MTVSKESFQQLKDKIHLVSRYANFENMLLGFIHSEDEILRNQDILKRLETKIQHIRDHPYDYEVACGEGETCTVAERTEDILQEILRGTK